MNNRFLDIYKIVMEYEGGYVNHPKILVVRLTRVFLDGRILTGKDGN